VFPSGAKGQQLTFAATECVADVDGAIGSRQMPVCSASRTGGGGGGGGGNIWDMIWAFLLGTSLREQWTQLACCFAFCCTGPAARAAATAAEAAVAAMPGPLQAMAADYAGETQELFPSTMAFPLLGSAAAAAGQTPAFVMGTAAVTGPAPAFIGIAAATPGSAAAAAAAANTPATAAAGTAAFDTEGARGRSSPGARQQHFEAQLDAEADAAAAAVVLEDGEGMDMEQAGQVCRIIGSRTRGGVQVVRGPWEGEGEQAAVAAMAAMAAAPPAGGGVKCIESKTVGPGKGVGGGP
jgi:pyruvate/2-oxoglutarate dehydrogenase complex dihydrolipoamide acyltransferase (E2) component